MDIGVRTEEAMDRLTCEQVREALWPLERPRMHTEGEADARAHVASCATCQAFFRRDARLSRRLEGAGLRVPCPDHLREGVAAAVDRAASTPDLGTRRGGPAGGGSRLRRARPAIPWMIAAATIVLASLGLLQPGPRDLEAAFVQDYRTRAAGQTAIESPDIDRIAAFFLQEVGFEAEPVMIASGSFTRAEVCYIDGQRAARVEYEIDGHAVAHYRVPVSAGPTTARAHTSTTEGVCVVRWSDGEFDHALVADMPESDLAVLARREFGAGN